MITDYMKKMITWEDCKSINYKYLPLRELSDFSGECKKHGINRDEGFKKLFEAVYEKTTAVDGGGYPKYKLRKNAKDILTKHLFKGDSTCLQ